MKTRIVLLALALFSVGVAAEPAFYPGTQTPMNDAWRQLQRDAEVEYTILRQAMVAFPRDKYPEVYDKFAAVAFGLEFSYQAWFGAPIKVLETVPAPIAPLTPPPQTSGSSRQNLESRSSR